MKIAILFFLLLTSAGALASEESPVVESAPPREIQGLVFISPELRYERGEGQEWEARIPINIGLGVRTALWSFLVEYERFESTTGNASANIKRAHEEALLWVQKDIWHQELISQWSADLYLGVGGGAFQEEVTTVLLNNSVTDKSKLYPVFALATGIQSRWFLFSRFPNLGFVTGLEVRALFSSEFDPNPQGALLARFGILF